MDLTILNGKNIAWTDNESLEKHFNKHVLGISLDDNRSNSIKNKEKNHWLKIKEVEDKYDYEDAAKDNCQLNEKTRLYIYRPKDGRLSINIQKRAIKYFETMNSNEFEGLLTTAIREDNSKYHLYDYNIITCFYKTQISDFVETLSMCVEMYRSMDAKMIKTSSNIHFKGFNLNTFNTELLKKFVKLYIDYIEFPKYNYELAYKCAIIHFLKDELKNYRNIYNPSMFSFCEILKIYVDNWINNYKNNKTYDIRINNKRLNNQELNRIKNDIGFEISDDISYFIDDLKMNSNSEAKSELFNLLSIKEREYEVFD